jgi:glycine/D-amino acid oxidase-like deaminating enzyme
MNIPTANVSLWREAYPATALYPQLTSTVEVDVVIVGAGITGLTAAYLLKKQGKTVAVLDKHTVGGGTTGRTTGKVTSQHNLIYAELEKKYGQTKARDYGQANAEAVETIAQIIKAEKIKCDWQVQDNYVYTVDARKLTAFRHEAAVAQSLGLPASFHTSSPLPFDVRAVVKFTDQATFDSGKYLLGLAKAVEGDGSYVFENSNVIGIREGKPCRVRTKDGVVYAGDIIVASSVPTFPLLARLLCAMYEYPMESYIVAGNLDRDQPGMYISPDKRQYSILPTTIDGQRRILIGGEAHFWGFRWGSKDKHFNRLADYARKHFGVTEITHAWSDRDYLPYDRIPLVGKLYPWSKHTYVGTAYQKWGLSNGTAAAKILVDTITGHENPYADTFDSVRKPPFKDSIVALTKAVLGLR